MPALQTPAGPEAPSPSSASLWGGVSSITNNPGGVIMKWEHGNRSSPRIFCVLCMYVCMIAAKRVWWGWGLGVQCFLSSGFVASPWSALSYVILMVFFNVACLVLSKTTMKWFQGKDRNSVRIQFILEHMSWTEKVQGAVVIAGPDQSSPCPPFLHQPRGHPAGRPLGTAPTPEVCHLKWLGWVRSTENSVLRALCNSLGKRDNNFWFLNTNHMELFCHGYNEEVSRNTHNTADQKNC